MFKFKIKNSKKDLKKGFDQASQMSDDENKILNFQNQNFEQPIDPNQSVYLAYDPNYDFNQAMMQQDPSLFDPLMMDNYQNFGFTPQPNVDQNYPLQMMDFYQDPNFFPSSNFNWAPNQQSIGNIGMPNFYQNQNFGAQNYQQPYNNGRLNPKNFNSNFFNSGSGAALISSVNSADNLFSMVKNPTLSNRILLERLFLFNLLGESIQFLHNSDDGRDFSLQSDGIKINSNIGNQFGSNSNSLKYRRYSPIFNDFEANNFSTMRDLNLYKTNISTPFSNSLKSVPSLPRLRIRDEFGEQ